MQDDEENSDEDYNPQPSTKRRKEEHMQIIQTDIQSIKADVEIKSLTMDPKTQTPLGLKNQVCETFKCCICHVCHVVPIRPPLIIAKCCKSIIGCEQCINEWYGGRRWIVKNLPTLQSR